MLRRIISRGYTSFALMAELELGILESKAAKKVNLMKRIGTHNGTFHCDEALACFMLRQLPEYRHAEIVRTRDPELLAKCDIVVDVGGVYNPDKHCYDHHQRGFTGSMKTLKSSKPWQTKLSSAGLVYLHFGPTLLAQILKTEVDDPVTDKIYDKVYENLIQEIDAIDNGIEQSDGEQRYSITTNVSSRVGELNPRWNAPNPDPEAQFKKAMNLVGEVFMDRVLFYKEAWLPARDLVKKAILERYQVDPSGEIIEFSEGGCPWKEHLFDLEKELEVDTPIKFAIYSDQNGKWRVQRLTKILETEVDDPVTDKIYNKVYDKCVSIRPKSFENRLSLLEEWRGIRDQPLSELSGIPGCIFVHASGFIGGNETREGAIKMAKKTLEFHKQNSMNTDQKNSSKLP